MTSNAKTVEEYLASLPEDRREAISQVRKVILDNLPEGYEEGMQYGMIGYYVPHSIYPPGYHCDPKQPLPYTHLASQKNYMSLYLMSIYMDSEHKRKFIEGYAKSGKKLDAGKACIRFKKVDDLALDVIAEVIRLPVSSYISNLESAISSRASTKKK